MNVLMVAEKPSLGQSIAHLLSGGKVREEARVERLIGYLRTAQHLGYKLACTANSKGGNNMSQWLSHCWVQVIQSWTEIGSAQRKYNAQSPSQQESMARWPMQSIVLQAVLAIHKLESGILDTTQTVHLSSRCFHRNYTIHCTARALAISVTTLRAHQSHQVSVNLDLAWKDG